LKVANCRLLRPKRAYSEYAVTGTEWTDGIDRWMRGAVGSGDVSVIGRLVVVPSRRGPGLGRWSVSATMSPCSSSTTSIPRPAEPGSPLSAPSRGFPTVSRAPGVCSFHRDRRRRARLAAGALVHTYARAGWDRALPTPRGYELDPVH